MTDTRMCTKCQAPTLHLTRKKIGGALGTKLTFVCKGCGEQAVTTGTPGNVAFDSLIVVGVLVVAFVVQGHALMGAPAGVYGVLAFFVGLGAWHTFNILKFNAAHRKV